MKNKKVVVILLSLTVLIGSIFLIKKTFQTKDNINKTKRKSQNNLAIMIKEDGAEDYTKSASKDIPKGNYTLNKEKSYCKNNGIIGDYDSALGKVSFSFIGTDSCYLYFDKIMDTEKPVISNLTVNDTIVTTILSDNIELSGYGISTSNSVEPTSWISINGISYNLSITITTEGTYYLWVKDSSENKTIKEFTISLGTSFETLMVENNSDIFDENGLRYEGADPNNYICLDNKKEGTCSNSSLLFRIIGLFDEEYSNNGSSSAGTKKLLKVIDTNLYGGSSGKAWNTNNTNNWANATLKSELNGTYLNTLKSLNSDLLNFIVNTKWSLGGANYSTEYATYNINYITNDNFYRAERAPFSTSGQLQNKYSTNPEYVYAKIGLIYPSDYGYATGGGNSNSKTECRQQSITKFYDYPDCETSNWLFNSQKNILNESKPEWTISPIASTSNLVTFFASSGYLVPSSQYIVRPTFYLDTSVLKVVGGTGTSTDPYHIG